jgi:Ca-activated chloride channel family protein
MNFLHPIFLLFLLAVPIYIVLFFFVEKSRGYGVSVLADLKRAARGGWGHMLTIIRHVFIISIMILLSIALARPQSAHQNQDISKEGIDIAIALDVSESMLAEDLSPNRIEAAKKSLIQFIEKRESDRVGIVIFSGTPFTQSPLTFDYEILTQYVDEIDTDSINQRVRGLGGTAIGDAILASLSRFDEDTDRTKIIVLLSDGDANVGVDPLVAAYKAKEKDVKIYTVGIGRQGGAPMPVYDNLGRKSVARNRDGSVYMTTFNEAAMRKISTISGGKFFRAEDNQAFEAVLREINALEKKDIEITKQLLYSDAFLPYLIALWILLFLHILLELLFGKLTGKPLSIINHINNTQTQKTDQHI